MPVIPIYEQRTTPDGALEVRNPNSGSEAIARGLESVAQGVGRVQYNVQRAAEQDDMVLAGQTLGTLRERVTASELAAKNSTGDPAANLSDAREREREIQRLYDQARLKMKTPRGRAFLESQYQDLWSEKRQRLLVSEASANVEFRRRAQEQSVETAARAVEADPSSYAKSAAEQLAVLDHLEMPETMRAERRQQTIERLGFAAALGRAKSDPGGLLEQLASPTPSDPAVSALSPEARTRLEAVAIDAQEEQQAQGILKLYREDVRAGDVALAHLEQSNLPPERLDGIRRKVREGVNLLRDERQAQAVDRIAALEAKITAGASFGYVQNEAGELYQRGALTPAQYASLLERGSANSVRTAEASAVQREIGAAINAGIPLDPQNAQHREFVASAFATDTQRMQPGAADWQGVALGYAGKTRMLPAPAASWLRSAARSPDQKVATSAAEFFGSLEQTSPEAAGNVDPDTRAFLGSLSGMLAAGAKPSVAFETARANVFETRRDVLEARRTAYKAEARNNAAALDAFIDRDFDTAFTRQPAASVTLTADFERQTSQYYSKVGDIGLARELAWKDLSRIYGVTEVNGQRTVVPFPIERFGVTPAEVRKDVGEFLAKHPQGNLRPEDVLVVPDAITLRSVGDAYTGKPTMPSYRLVTPSGDLVVGPDGVPVRYTLPSGEELTRRVQAAQRKARQDATAAVEDAKRRRDVLHQQEWERATRLIPVGPKE